MEIDNHLNAIQESLKYSILYIEGIDYSSKYGLSHDQSYKQKLETLRPIKEALSAVINRKRELKNK